MKATVTERDREYLELARRIAKHSPPIAASPDAARMALIRLSLEMLLKAEKV